MQKNVCCWKVYQDQLENCASVQHMSSAAPDRLNDFRTEHQLYPSIVWSRLKKYDKTKYKKYQ